MTDSLGGIIDGAHDALDKIEDSGIVDSITGGNVMLDPAPELSSIFAQIFAAIVEIFSVFRNMMKIA